MRAPRKRRIALLFVAVLAIAVVGVACDPAPPPPPCGPAPGFESDIFNQVNADRAANGLGPLSWNCTPLWQNAGSWANQMATTGVFAHQNLSGVISGPDYSNFASLGENILVGPGNMTGVVMEQAWMNSPGHRANILGNFDSIGVGVARGADGRLWGVQEFGRHF